MNETTKLDTPSGVGLMQLLDVLLLNARLIPDQAMNGTTDVYAVPIDDIDALRWFAEHGPLNNAMFRHWISEQKNLYKNWCKLGPACKGWQNQMDKHVLYHSILEGLMALDDWLQYQDI